MKNIHKEKTHHILVCINEDEIDGREALFEEDVGDLNVVAVLLVLANNAQKIWRENLHFVDVVY